MMRLIWLVTVRITTASITLTAIMKGTGVAGWGSG